jgi:hypothetical protein
LVGIVKKYKALSFGIIKNHIGLSCPSSQEDFFPKPINCWHLEQQKLHMLVNPGVLQNTFIIDAEAMPVML